jgi:hypothetical protein
MFTPPKRQIPPMVYPEVCVCLILLFELVFPTGLVRLSRSYVWHFSSKSWNFFFLTAITYAAQKKKKMSKYYEVR